MKNIRHTSIADVEQKLQLMNLVFGPGRFVRSVYRLREKQVFEQEFSYVSVDGNKIIACIDYCRTKLNDQFNGLLLGPLAVHPDFKSLGYGIKLVEYSLKKVGLNKDYSFIIVVGDIKYYERFGFCKVEGALEFYGPVDRDRVLIKKMNKIIDKSINYKFT
jgi:predicted N-acetyltransferase YhbS